MPTVKVNDINIYYEILGDGEPLLFIVGLSADISEYDGVLHSLAKKYKVIAFDNRGAGRSDKPDTEYSMEMMAEDAFGLMKMLGIEQTNVIGHSMGGKIALALALKHPENVKKLILASTSVKKIKNWRISGAGWLRALPAFRSKYPQPHFAFKRQYNAVAKGDFTNRLSELKMPVAIMHGIKDKIVAYASGKEVHKAVESSQLVSFNGGHLFLLIKERQAFVDATEKFLS